MASRQVTEEPQAVEQPGTDAVCVAVHIRPLVPSELAEGCQPCLAVTPGQPQARSQLCNTGCWCLRRSSQMQNSADLTDVVVSSQGTTFSGQQRCKHGRPRARPGPE